MEGDFSYTGHIRDKYIHSDLPARKIGFLNSHTHIHAHIHTYIHTVIFPRVRYASLTHTRIYMYIYIYIYIYIYTHTHTHIHTCIPTYIQ